MICTPFLQLILRMYYPIAITRLHDSNGLFLWPIFRDLAYRSTALEKVLAGTEVLLVTERSRQNGKRQHTGIALASLKRGFRLGAAGDDTGGARHQDRGEEDLRLHLRLPDQPPLGEVARVDQRLVGLRSPQHSSTVRHPP